MVELALWWVFFLGDEGRGGISRVFFFLGIDENEDELTHHMLPLRDIL